VVVPKLVVGAVVDIAEAEVDKLDAVVDIVETRTDNPNFEQHWHQA
jgi:hypothetical protein